MNKLITKRLVFTSFYVTGYVPSENKIIDKMITVGWRVKTDSEALSLSFDSDFVPISVNGREMEELNYGMHEDEFLKEGKVLEFETDSV